MVAAGWTEAQKRAYVLADNQLAITGSGWDPELLRGRSIGWSRTRKMPPGNWRVEWEDDDRDIGRETAVAGQQRAVFEALGGTLWRGLRPVWRLQRSESQEAWPARRKTPVSRAVAGMATWWWGTARRLMIYGYARVSTAAQDAAAGRLWCRW
jgi:hypothetical protein